MMKYKSVYQQVINIPSPDRVTLGDYRDTSKANVIEVESLKGLETATITGVFDRNEKFYVTMGGREYMVLDFTRMDGEEKSCMCLRVMFKKFEDDVVYTGCYPITGVFSVGAILVSNIGILHIVLRDSEEWVLKEAE